jgi:hypothetical protein
LGIFFFQVPQDAAGQIGLQAAGFRTFGRHQATLVFRCEKYNCCLAKKGPGLPGPCPALLALLVLLIAGFFGLLIAVLLAALALLAGLLAGLALLLSTLLAGLRLVLVLLLLILLLLIARRIVLVRHVILQAWVVPAHLGN